MRDPHACTQPGGKRGRGGRRPLGGGGSANGQWCLGDTTGVVAKQPADDGCGPQSWDPLQPCLCQSILPRAQGDAHPSRGTHSPGTSWGRSLVLAPQEKALWEGPLSPWIGLPAKAPAPHLELRAIPRGWLPGCCPPPVRWQCQGSKTPGPGLWARARPHLNVHCPLSCGLGFLPYSSPQTPDPRSS